MKKHVCEYDEQNRSRFKQRLWAFFSKYDPEKLVSISRRSNDDIISRTLALPIFEDVCLAKTCAKYDVDPKQEEESAKRAKLFPKESKDIDNNDDDDDDSDFDMIEETEEMRLDRGLLTIESEYNFIKNSISDYSAAEKSRLARRLERFFSEMVEQTAENENNSSEVRSAKIEKLLLGNVTEEELLKRLCSRYSVDEMTEQVEARAFSLYPRPKPVNHTPPPEEDNNTDETYDINNSSAASKKKEESTVEKKNTASTPPPVASKPFSASLLMEEVVEATPTVTSTGVTKTNNEETKDEEEEEGNDEEEEVEEEEEEEEEIEFKNPVPVSSYTGSNRDRFYRRVLAFYKLHKPSENAAKRAAGILEMNHTEPTIISQLCKKYSVKKSEERQFARKFEGFPEYAACCCSVGGPIRLYDKSEKSRFIRRVVLFYQNSSNDAAANDEAKLNKLLTVKESEDTIFATLMAKYKYDPKREEAEAREAGLFPDDDEDEEEEAEEEEDDENDGDENESSTKSHQQFAQVCSYPPHAKKRLRERLVDFNEKFDASSDKQKEDAKIDRAMNSKLTENEVFDALCQNFKVHPLDEQDQARFHNLLPVCAYDSEERSRLKKRLLLFYKNYHKEGIAKIDDVLRMVTTEEQIFETLVKKYCEGKTRQEQAQALRQGVFPLEDEEDQIKKNAGTLQVKDYPLFEKKYRLRKRVELFYSRHIAPENETERKALQNKIDRVLLMENTEREIFYTLCKRYKEDGRMEEKIAKEKGLFPKF